MLVSKILKYKNKIIRQFQLCSKELVNNIQDYSNTLSSDKIKDIRQKTHDLINIGADIQSKLQFFPVLHLIHSLDLTGSFFSYNSKIHVNRILKPILDKERFSDFSKKLFAVRKDLVAHLLKLYHDNLLSINEKYFMVCSFFKSWNLVPIKDWNSIFDSFINELHLYSAVQIANILLIHNSVQHLGNKGKDVKIVFGDYIHPLGLDLIAKNLHLLNPKKIIEIFYLETRRSPKLIEFYNISHKHLIKLDDISLGNITTLIRLNQRIIEQCLIDNSDTRGTLSNVLDLVEVYVRRKSGNLATSKGKYHFILIMDALSSYPFLKSLYILLQTASPGPEDVGNLLYNYNLFFGELLNISHKNIGNIEDDRLKCLFRSSCSKYSKFFSMIEISSADRKIQDLVLSNIEKQCRLIT